MNKKITIKKRLSTFYLPFLCFSVGVTALYTVLHWLLIIELNLFHLKEMYLIFLLPALIAFLITMFYFYKRIQLFKLLHQRDLFHCFVCMTFLALPMGILQNYLAKSMGEMIVLEYPSQIDIQHPAKYYSIKQAFVPNAGEGISYSWKMADNDGRKFSANIYFAIPLYDSICSPYTPHKKNIWIVKSFSERFYNSRLEKETEIKRMNAFFDSCCKKFKHYSFQTHYLKNAIDSDDYPYYAEAVNNAYSLSDKNQCIILKEEEGDYKSRLGAGFQWFLGTFLFGNFIWFLLVCFTPIDPLPFECFTSKELRAEEKAMEKEYKMEWWRLFIPTKKIWATPLILDLNILIFVVMLCCGIDCFNPQAKELLAWGGLYKPLVEDGQYWRLLTALFLHSGILHLMYNLIICILIGLFLEVFVGSGKLMIIYLLTGIIGGLSNLWFNEPTVSVGASGAIMGIMGLSLSLVLIKYFDDESISTFIGIMVAILAGATLFVSLLRSNIDIAAHLGGLISGFVIGIAVFPWIKKPNEPKRKIKQWQSSQNNINIE